MQQNSIERLSQLMTWVRTAVGCRMTNGNGAQGSSQRPRPGGRTNARYRGECVRDCDHDNEDVLVKRPLIKRPPTRGLLESVRDQDEVVGVRMQQQVMGSVALHLPENLGGMTGGVGVGSSRLFSVYGRGLHDAWDTAKRDNNRPLVHHCTAEGDIIWDDFLLEAPVGEQGGMGVVVLASVKDCRKDEPQFKGFHKVVLKMALAGNEDALIDEGSIGARLIHENIIRQVGVVWSAKMGFPALVMQRCKGPTLYHLIEEHGAMSELRSLLTMEQLLSAVAYMHSKGIAHLDIKPGNVMSREALSERVPTTWKLLDFGLSIQLESSVYDCSYSSSRGTVGYMPPEMYDGQQFSPGYCDVWSLGVLFLELVTGRKVFEASSDKSYEALMKTDLKCLHELAMASLRQRSAPERIRNLVLIFLEPLGQRPTAQQLHKVVSSMAKSTT